ncbi:site-specific integrase [Pseudoalteromonas arctica]|uniref:Site-specific integrase n=1 Tax=Pseudoalteromonas arctica TaxID=394751 RepID=A0AAP6Y953_9GAMM|nr:site-specific integrase [Pseudoalteromonas arctica]NMP04843.1 site-specific integrase [Pseudoalteromonas arctica]
MIIEQLPQYILIKKALDQIAYDKRAQNKKNKSQQDLDNINLFNTILLNKVSEESLFSDSKWKLITCEIVPSTLKSRYIIDWHLYPNIPGILLFKFKLLANLSIIDKTMLCVAQRTKKLSVLTIVRKLKIILKFFNSCFLHLSNKHGAEYTSSITMLTEIDSDTTSFIAKKNKNGSQVSMREALKSIDKLNILKLLNEKPNIRVKFSELPFRELTEQEKKPRNNICYIPSEIFQILSANASLDIADFLYATNTKPSCKATDNAYQLAIQGGYYTSTKYSYNVLESTAAIFFIHSESLRSNIELYTATCNLYNPKTVLSKSDLKSQNIAYKDVRKYLMDIQTKAIFIISAYTGMRPRELIHLDLVSRDALTEEDGIMQIYANIIKGRKRTRLFTDKFIVIPIVYDAIRTIKVIKHLHRSQFKQVEQLKDAPLNTHTIQSIQARIQYFIDESIGKGIIHFYPYLLRHNLAYQLYRVELGLPFISYALKHVVSGIDRFKSVSKVTLGYGGIGDKLAGKSLTSLNLQKEVSLERVKSQFNPDGKYSGGGAKKHTEHLRTIFQGYMASGYRKDEIYEKMIEQGYYLMNVGKLYCMANEATEKFDTSLPCIGSLRCNPVDCPNALISNEHASVWKETHAENIAIKMELAPISDSNKVKYNQINSAIDLSTKVLNSLTDGK